MAKSNLQSLFFLIRTDSYNLFWTGRSIRIHTHMHKSALTPSHCWQSKCGGQQGRQRLRRGIKGTQRCCCSSVNPLTESCLELAALYWSVLVCVCLCVCVHLHAQPRMCVQFCVRDLRPWIHILSSLPHICIHRTPPTVRKSKDVLSESPLRHFIRRLPAVLYASPAADGALLLELQIAIRGI